MVRVLVRYDAPPGEGERAALAAAGALVLAEVRVVPLLVAWVEERRLGAVARAQGVVGVEPDLSLAAALDRSRGAVRADVAQSLLQVTGRGVTIAVLDGGIDPMHPDVGPKVLARHDATLSPGPWRSLGGPPLPVAPDLVDGHATHVAGIAAGNGQEGRGRYTGIAPGAALVDVKVLDAAGRGHASHVLQGLDWVLEHAGRLRVRVALMSFAGPPTDGTDALGAAVDAASARGLLVVAAAGNGGPGPGTVGTPASARSAMAVGAVDDLLRVAASSARGPTPDGRPKPDLVAPGVAIVAPVPLAPGRGAGYAERSGTSAAAAHVAGAAALLAEAAPGLAPEDLAAILRATAVSLGPHGWDAAHGHGLLDAERAVRAALDGAGIAASQASQPSPAGWPGALRAAPAGELPALAAALALAWALARRSR